LDLGFLVLSQNVISEVVKHGGKAVKASAVLSDAVPDMCLLVGHAARHACVTTDTIARDDDAGQEWLRRRLTGLPVTFSRLRCDGAAEAPHTLRFTPLAGIDDYCGTSGGPIFGYKRGCPINEYSLFAIQSTQVREATREQKVKFLIGTSGKFAVEAIHAFLVHAAGNQARAGDRQEM